MPTEEQTSLLIDYVSGRATSAQCTEIEQAISTSPVLAEEVAYYQGLRNVLSQKKVPVPTDELGWARLSKAIAEEAGPKAANDNHHFWKYAAAGLGLLVGVQALFLAGNFTSPAEPVYTTASQAQSELPGLHIAFNPQANADEITQTLYALKGDVTGGPSALGLYSVSFETEALRDAALSTLRAKTSIIESATIK